MQTFKDLGDEYKAALINAKSEAKEESENGKTYDCSFCGERNTVAIINRDYICKYCGSDDQDVDCCVCGISFMKSKGHIWNDDDPVHKDYICDGCYEDVMHR